MLKPSIPRAKPKAFRALAYIACHTFSSWQPVYVSWLYCQSFSQLPYLQPLATCLCKLGVQYCQSFSLYCLPAVAIPLAVGNLPVSAGCRCRQCCINSCNSYLTVKFVVVSLHIFYMYCNITYTIFVGVMTLRSTVLVWMCMGRCRLVEEMCSSS